MPRKTPAKAKDVTDPIEEAVLRRIAGMFATFDDLETLSDRIDRLELQAANFNPNHWKWNGATGKHEYHGPQR